MVHPAEHDQQQPSPVAARHAMRLTYGIFGLNIIVLLWLFFEPYISYQPGSKGPGPGFHYELRGFGIILFMLFCNGTLAIIALIASTGFRRRRSILYEYLMAASRAFFLALLVVLLVGIPTCIASNDIGRQFIYKKSLEEPGSR